mgnify:CR=1 FL=1
MEPKEIDFNCQLGEHGWSEFRFASGDSEAIIRTTHIFSNPLIELLESLVELLKGEKKSTFYWYDEPGSYKVEFEIEPSQHHLVIINITEHASTGEWNENDTTIFEYRFYTKLQLFSACVFGELGKLNELMKVRTYAENRNSEYPYSFIKEFNREYAKKYS